MVYRNIIKLNEVQLVVDNRYFLFHLHQLSSPKIANLQAHSLELVDGLFVVNVPPRIWMLRFKWLNIKYKVIFTQY